MRMLADGIYIAQRGTGCLSTPMGEDDVAQLAGSLRAAIRQVPADGRSVFTHGQPHSG